MHNTVIQMAVAYQTQTLTESFGAEYDDNVSFYETEQKIKLEQVDAMDLKQMVETIENNVNLQADKTFLDLSSSVFDFDGLKQGDLMYTDEKDMKSWTEKHPEHWSTIEVLDWIYYVAAEHKLDVTVLRGENFNTITGPQLCAMTIQEFQEKDPEYGTYYYQLFQQILAGARFLPPANVEPNVTEMSGYFPQGTFTTAQPTVPLHLQQDMVVTDDQTSTMLDNNFDAMLDIQDGVPKVNIAGSWYDFEPDWNMDMPWCDNEDHGYGSGDSDVNSEFGSNDHSRLPSVTSDILSEDEDSGLDAKPKKNKPAKRTSNEEGEEGKTTGSQRGRKPGQSSKGNHLWEFIRDLLKDPQLNPSLLRWEDKENGVFRFVQSEAVAQMWGRKKNNPGMTYEKLSRAMRFCRSAGYFDSVPKTGKYPKKLCFRFGPKAYGWTAM